MPGARPDAASLKLMAGGLWKPTVWHIIEDKGNAFDCHVYSNRVQAIKWMQTGEPAEMRQNEDGLNGSITHKSALFPFPAAKIVVIT